MRRADVKPAPDYSKTALRRKRHPAPLEATEWQITRKEESILFGGSPGGEPAGNVEPNDSSGSVEHPVEKASD